MPKTSSPTMVLTRRPMPSISVTTSSPGRTSTTPSGVPVRITSPRLKVMKLVRYSTRNGMSNTRSRVLPSCVLRPFTKVRSVRLPGSGTSAASTSQGPRTVQVSRFFTRAFGR